MKQIYAFCSDRLLLTEYRPQHRILRLFSEAKKNAYVPHAGYGDIGRLD